MWETGEIYKADKMGERAELCPTLISILKRWEEILFQ